jgi:hypothetical protein
MKVRTWLILPAALLLASCAVSMVKMDRGTVTVKDAITVASDGAWNRLDLPDSGRESEVWTSDGLSLDVLTFIVGIKDGDPLVQPPMGAKRTPPAFRSTMIANEIVELYEASAIQDGSTFKMEHLAPAQFAGSSGFRFEFSMTRKRDDVTLRGFGQGAVIKGRLYLIVFRAPRLHYYAKHLPRAEATVRSALVKI